jgi:hypothetical protein
MDRIKDALALRLQRAARAWLRRRALADPFMSRW